MSLNTHGIKSVKYEVLYPLKKEKVRANIAPLIGSAGASVCTAHTEAVRTQHHYSAASAQHTAECRALTGAHSCFI